MRTQELTTVLVTGVGDTVGQALLKAARQSALPCRVLGTDRHEFAAGFRWVDARFVLPHCSRPDAYLSEMRRICAGEGVQLILPGSEVELGVLSRNADALRADTGATVVASPPDVLGIALDKWETCRFLERSGLNFPRYARADAMEEVERLIDEVGFPLIAKPFRGTGGRGLVKVESRADFKAVHAAGVAMVVQEYLQPDEEEYTVAAYTQRDGRQAGSIAFKRELCSGGDTYRAWVAQNPVVLAEAEAILRALRPSGPCNVQLRLTARGPVAFEINARFSGTTAMRAHFGYNEVEMAIRDIVRDEPVPQPKIKPGVALRFWEEMYLDGKPEPQRAAEAHAAT